MSTFAKIDGNNNVVEVIVADKEFIDSGAVGDANQWIECCANNSMRGRYPGPGYIYDADLDEFLPPKPVKFPSWVWNGGPGYEGRWIPPIPFPADAEANKEMYDWNEATQSWDPRTLEELTFELSGRLLQALNTGAPISTSEFTWK